MSKGCHAEVKRSEWGAGLGIRYTPSPSLSLLTLNKETHIKFVSPAPLSLYFFISIFHLSLSTHFFLLHV